MSAATTTSGKSKTAGKVSPSRPTPHVTPASQHANGTVMTKSNSKPVVQPKLTVGKPNDSYEQQADAMAQKVVRMTPADIQQLSASKQTIRRQINPSAENNPSRSVLQKKDQPGAFMMQASPEKEKLGKKEDEKLKKKDGEKLQKKEEEKIKKKPDEKLQKAEPEKIQKAAEPVLTKPIQLKEEEKLQKTEELKKRADEKLQKAEPEKIQKAAEPVLAKPIQLKEEEKLQKTEELKKKADEKLQPSPSEKKAEPEKIQKAAEPVLASKETIQPKPVAVVQSKPVQLKEEEKLRKTEELKKAPEEKVQKKTDEKLQKVSDPKVLAAKETVQAKPLAVVQAKPVAVVQAKPVQLKEEEKLRKAEPEQQKPKEFEGAGKVQKKAEAEKIQKAETNSIQPQIQLTVTTTTTPVQLKEEEKLKKATEEKLQKAADEKLQKAADEKLQKAAGEKPQKAGDEKIMKMPEGSESDQLTPEFEARLQGTLSGGAPMERGIRSFMESRFDADFSLVRFHMDTTAVQMCNEIGARAFAYKNHVYFNRGQYSPDTDSGRFLIAHELTHVIQQGYATQKGGAENTPARIAPKADEKLQASQNISSSSPRIQRIGWDTVNNAVRRAVPVWTLLTVIMGNNPILGESVPRGPVQWFQALLDLIPVIGPSIFDKLRESGMIARAEAWFNSVFADLPSMGEIRSTWDRCWSEMGILEGIDGNIAIFRRHFSPIFTRITTFVSRVLNKIVEFLRETLLRPLNNVIKDIPGWDLITTLIGSNPLTGEEKPRTAMNVIRGVVAFIPGGQEKLDQLVQSGALEKAYQWFITETTARNLTWARISATFTRAWDSLSANDILHPIDTFNRLRGMVSPLLSDLAGFALAALIKLLELIYEAVMGAGGARVLTIVKRTQATFLTIIRNPVGFLGNLLRAVGMGIRNFGTNILRHLQTGVITWLTGTLARGGVEIPRVWDLTGILRLVMSILGLTWPRIREIAVRVFGPTVVAVLETTAGLVMDIREKGFVQTMRDRISELFGNVREMILGRIKSFIQTRIVMAGIQWLASMLSPVGAVIQAIIKTYETVMFFIQKINEIMEFVETILNAVDNIANGALGPAAAYVENAMARTIPLILDFLARLLGLGDVGGMVRGIIQQVQAFIAQKIEQAMVAIRGMVQRLIAAGTSAVARVLNWWRTRKNFQTPDGHNHSLYFQGEGPSATLMIASEPEGVEQRVRNRLAAGQPVLSQPQRDKLGEALTNKRNLDTYIRTNTATPGPNANTTGLQNEINNRLDIIKQNLIDGDALPATTAPPLSNLTYEKSGNKAHKAQAEPLTRLAGNTRGTEPPRGNPNIPPGWSHVLLIDGPTPSNYGRSHLVSMEFHGPGADWNLTPAKETVNSSMRSGVEQEVKNVFTAEPDAVLSYKTEVTYFQQSDPAKSYETDFPESIVVMWGRMTPIAGQQGRYAPPANYLTRPYRGTRPDPPPAPGTVPVPDINGMGRTQLKTLFDNRDELSRDIVAAKGTSPTGRFNNLLHMMLVVNRYYAANKPGVDFLNTYWSSVILPKYNNGRFRFF